MKLLYVFLNNNFSKIESNKKDFSYARMPDYYQKTFNFNMQHFDDGGLICQEEEMNGKFKNYVSVESLMQMVEFKTINEILEKKWARYKIEFFLYHAFMRLIFVCLAIKKMQLTDVIHVEADNTIYSDERERFSRIFQPGEFGYGLVSMLDAAPGVIFFKDSQAADNFLNQLIKLLKKGEEEIVSTTGIPFSYITDMNFLYLMFLYNKNYKMLPCLPVGDYSQNYNNFNILFDPAGYGQFLGGTNNSNPPGYINPRQFVGAFLQNKQIEVKFDSKPYILYHGKQIPLYNLHIHNKKAIENFI